jgi:phosphoribosylformimino-5-aminoimidazole carboxamide ribotide isomerase
MPYVTRFRPCIDLHRGQVKQIVGGTLSDSGQSLKTNFVSDHSAGWFAELYRKDNLTGGHVIKLGPGNDTAAREALTAWPGGLQIGGGIDIGNAGEWINAGASHVIVTSCLFSTDGIFRERKLRELVQAVGADKLVLDLSCRRLGSGWAVAMNRWQTITSLRITRDTLDSLAEHCSEFLIHAADVEGLCLGIDEELVAFLGEWKGRPMTYAGGIASLKDFDRINTLSQGSMDATVGSALDIFGGESIRYADLVQRQSVSAS